MSDKADQMAPDASPGELGKKSGVRRVNNMPMYLLFGVVGLFLIVMALVAADRAAKQNAPGKGEQERAGSSSIFANEIAGFHEGIIAPAEPLEIPELPTEANPEPATDAVLIARPDNPDAPPLPASGNYDYLASSAH